MKSEKKDIINFIKSLHAGTASDFKYYNNPACFTRLQLICLEDIMFILFTFKSESAKANSGSRNQSVILETLNTPNKQTGLTIIDYCLAGCFEELFYKLASIGCRADTALLVKNNIEKYYTNDSSKPNMIIALESMISSEVANQQNETNKTTISKLSIHKKVMSSLLTSHRFPVILLFLGIAFCVASIATPFLLTIGIAAIVGSITSYQNAYNAISNSEQLDIIKSSTEQACFLRDLYGECKELQYTLKANANMRQLISPSTNVYKYNSRDNTTFMLHRFNSSESSQENNSTLSARLTHEKLNLV